MALAVLILTTNQWEQKFRGRQALLPPKFYKNKTIYGLFPLSKYLGIGSNVQPVFQQYLLKELCLLYLKSLPDTLALDEPKLSELKSFCLCRDITQKTGYTVLPM